MNRYSFTNTSILISMTESKLYARNIHTDTIPASDQYIPYTKDEEEVSKDLDIPPKKSSSELARRVMTIVLYLITMVAIVYPILIIPGTMIIILPIEIVLVDRIYDEIVKSRKSVNCTSEDLVVKDTIDDSMEKHLPRASVYGERSPG
jgi:hypothetical protein